MFSKIFNGIGDACEAFFKILPPIGPVVDFLIILIGLFAIVAWIVYMTKAGKDAENQ